MSLPQERRRQLQLLGLRALLKQRMGGAGEDVRPVAFGGGVAVLGATGVAAAFADDVISLGAAVDLARREGAAALVFYAEGNDGAVARRAAEFGLDITVINPSGAAEGIDPAPPEPVAPMPPAFAPAAEHFAAARLDTVVEHGVLLGEYLGLEVARAWFEDGTLAVDVGVGKHDRESARLLHPEGPSVEVIADARAIVADLRRAGALPHPANQLVPERWLRAVLVADPSMLGLTGLEIAEPATARADLRQRGVAPAVNDDVIVVCSVGVDPDVVAQAADARLHVGGDRRMLIAVPDGDDHPLTRRLAGALRRPAEVVTVPADWRAGGGH